MPPKIGKATSDDSSGSDNEADHSYEPEPSNSKPRKRASVTASSSSSSSSPSLVPSVSKSPLTKAAIKKAHVAAKKQRQDDWKARCEACVWIPEKSYEPPTWTEVMFKSDAMREFRLKDFEMDTLPYIQVLNPKRPSHPVRRYNKEDLQKLAYDKAAALDGVEDGKAAHEARIQVLEQRKASSSREPAANKPTTYTVVPKRAHSPLTNRLPVGSWETPVHEDGKLIGYSLNFQFDPLDGGPEDDHDQEYYNKFSRFRPV